MAARNVSPASAGHELLYDSSPRTRFRLGFDRVIGWLLPLLFIVALYPILDLVYYIGKQALPTMTFAEVTSTAPYKPGLGVPIIGTFEMMLFATSLAIVFGLFGGIAVAEFVPERPAGYMRMAANLLVGTPSVILGYTGYVLFCLTFGWGLSIIAGSFTLAFFMTPYIFRISDLAFSSIPRHIREAALGSGARPYQYVMKVGAPVAFPQILNGVFLAMAIGVGETAPIVFTTTQSVVVPSSIYSPVTFLTALIWTSYSSPGGSTAIALAFQAAFILLIVVIGLNIVVRLVSARYQKRLEGLFQ
jgi:phosphate transport system permease protein